MTLAPLDWIVIGVIALSVAMGAIRGFLAEVLGIAVWVGAVTLAVALGPTVAASLSTLIATPLFALAVGYGLVFFALTIAGAIALHLLRRLTRGSGLESTDRLLGALFGFTRAMLFVTVLVALARLTPLPAAPFWGASMTLPAFVALGDAGVALIPSGQRAWLAAAAFESPLPEPPVTPDNNPAADDDQAGRDQRAGQGPERPVPR